MVELKISPFDSHRLKRNAVLLVALGVVLYLAYLVREIWLPLIIALLIAMVLDPLVDRMERRGWSRLKGSALIYVCFFLAVGGTLAVAVPPIVSQSTEIANKIGSYLPSGDNESQTKHKLSMLLHKFHATKYVEDNVMKASGQIAAGLNNAKGWVGKAAAGAASNLIWLVIVPIVTFYALKDFHLIYARLLLLLPREKRGEAQQFLNNLTGIFVGYLRGLLIVCALNAVVTAIVLLIFGVPNALALGAISGILYMVPYLGAALTIGIIGGVCLLAGMTGKALFVVGTMIVLHSIIFDQLVTPRIVGKQVGLHPIISIVALLAGGSLLGILGMILAVPIAATIQMTAMLIFPKLGSPIEVPSAEQIHEKVVEEGAHTPNTGDEVKDAVNVHQTIMDAVDVAEQHQQEADDEAATLAA